MAYDDFIEYNKKKVEIKINVNKISNKKQEGFIMDLSCSGLPIQYGCFRCSNYLPLPFYEIYS